ncbi:NUDIX hydrolase [Candidatus Microgenomates bacterium]|nr:NUDIX hydrolase [Candidatus Microgenomates bacterium]
MAKIKYPKIKDRELHRISSTVIIYKGGKFLITRRALTKKTFPGRWTVPGGGLEIDDYINTKPHREKSLWYYALEKTMRRECLEEVGLKVGKIKFLVDMALFKPGLTPTLILSFMAPYKSGKVKLDAESTEFAWVTLRESKKYDLIGGIYDELKMADYVLRGKDPQKVKL